MAFCTNCGRELIPGQKCICQQEGAEQAGQQTEVQQAAAQQAAAQQAAAQQAAAQQASTQQEAAQQAAAQMAAYQQMASQQIEKVNVNVQGYFKVFCEVLSKPKSFGGKLVEEANLVKAFVFIVVQAILSGIFVTMKFGKINSAMESYVALISSDSSDVAKLNMYKFPLFKDFIITVVASVALSCVLAVVLWAMISVFKGKASFANTINASAVSCIGKTPIILLAIIVSFVSVSISIIIFMLSALVGLCYYCVVATAGTGVSEDKNAVIAFVIAFAAILCTYIYIRYCGELYFSSAIRTAYSQFIIELKDKIRDAGEQFGNLYSLFN